MLGFCRVAFSIAGRAGWVSGTATLSVWASLIPTSSRQAAISPRKVRSVRTKLEYCMTLYDTDISIQIFNPDLGPARSDAPVGIAVGPEHKLCSATFLLRLLRRHEREFVVAVNVSVES